MNKVKFKESLIRRDHMLNWDKMNWKKKEINLMLIFLEDIKGGCPKKDIMQ